MINGAILTFIDEYNEEKSMILSAPQLQVIIDVLGIYPKNEEELNMWSDAKIQLMHINGIKEISDLISKPKLDIEIKATDSKKEEVFNKKFNTKSLLSKFQTNEEYNS